MRLSTADFIAKKESEIGRRFRSKDVGQEGHHQWLLEHGTYMEQSNLPEKVLVIERIRLLNRATTPLHQGGAKEGDVEYRLGYYIVARNGRWWWGQYSQMIPGDDLRRLWSKARERGTLLPEHDPTLRQVTT